jgi:hypothetical protein
MINAVAAQGIDPEGTSQQPKPSPAVWLLFAVCFQASLTLEAKNSPGA